VAAEFSLPGQHVGQLLDGVASVSVTGIVTNASWTEVEAGAVADFGFQVDYSKARGDRSIAR